MGYCRSRCSSGEKPGPMAVPYNDKQPLCSEHERVEVYWWHHNIRERMETRNKQIILMCGWINFQLDESKCKEMCITFSRPKRLFSPIDVNGKPIEIVSNAKGLSVNISEDIKWNINISEIVKTLFSSTAETSENFTERLNNILHHSCAACFRICLSCFSWLVTAILSI